MEKITREQWEQRVSNAGAGRYKFVRWAVDGEIGWRSKVTVECNSCLNAWSASPNNLVRGTKCPNCSGNKKVSKEDQEKRINNAGLGRYEFVRWCDNGKFSVNDRCVVMCVIDGHVWDAYVNNLVNKKRGCMKCRGRNSSSNLRADGDIVSKEIQKISNGKFTFIRFIGEYVNCYSKAECVCNYCMSSWISSVTHLKSSRSGCPQCAGVRRWTAEERIEQINEIYNIQFVSWIDEYKGKDSKANVRCEIDGFEWNASVHHLVNNGSGCPKCAKSGYDPSKTGYLYALRSECGMYIKVGISNEPKRRHKQLEKRTPFKFNLIEQFSGDGVKISELEKHFHSKYERAGFTGFDGCTEWLVCTPELLEELRNLGDK